MPDDKAQDDKAKASASKQDTENANDLKVSKEPNNTIHAPHA